MKKKTQDLLLAIGLLLFGYFFGDIVVKVNNNYIDFNPEKEKVFQDKEEQNGEKIDFKKLNSDLKKGVVKYIVDGDTILLNNGEKVRYIGIDTPERGECWYQEAKNFNRKLVEAKTIKLEKDKSNRDRYQRLLRYIYLEDKSGKEVFVNLELVKAGLAKAKEYKPDIKFHLLFEKAEEQAKKEKIGMWSGKCLK